MPYAIDYTQARAILADALHQAEQACPAIAPDIAARIEKLFSSATQAYREALVGCLLARCVDPRINIRHPATETSAQAFSGRGLADQLVTPFLQEHAIPVSKSPYLSALRGGARFEPGGAPRIQRDAEGFDALVAVVAQAAEAPPEHAQTLLVFLLHRFVALRQASRIALRRIARPHLRHLTQLATHLLAARSGGRCAALLATALFRAVSEAHGLGWEVEFQGINVADAASGAVGDITIRRADAIVLGVEVTERQVTRARVTATFEQKIAPNGLADYLFVTTQPPEPEALAAASAITALGHEINFVQILPWLVNMLASMGPQGRALFQTSLIALLETQNADLKVLWNASMDSSFG